jgi:hypothetical protein
MSVFSGKIDHCIWIAEEVRERLMSSSRDKPDAADPYRLPLASDESAGPTG